MAEPGSPSHKLSSVETNLIREPVAIPCGHSYCRSCIEGYWDQDEQGIYSCPQCNQTFTPRPTLRKNNMLAEVVETLKKTGLQAAPPALCYVGPGDVACDFCTGTRKPSCPVWCLTVRLTSNLTPGLKKHKLVNCVRAEGLLEPLKQELVDLRRRDAELEKLSHTEDHIHFLQVTILSCYIM
uniref:RING-type domain-containing protein n=1 Tax=Oncorhynchus tshawytscha TaxID=74940 RepID=A0A8C8FL71_ONCTS